MATAPTINVPGHLLRRELAKLKTQIASYRADKQRPGQLIPQAIRRAVLEAVANGVTPATIGRELGITSRQLYYWRKEIRKLSSKPKAMKVEPRVFSVTEASEQLSGHEDLELSFSIGPWHVALSHTGVAGKRRAA